jgi:hypothetical protein
MNFLSHYYFDRKSDDPYHILGVVLPDLVKNADKKINLHPEKQADHEHTQVNAITQGWKRHIEVDKCFHTSEFFMHHSHQLKLALQPAIAGSPVKPFFLGHVALELILDNLLITSGWIEVEEFYTRLDIVENEAIQLFFEYNSYTDHPVFFNFFEEFKRHRYLNTYAETQQVAYALKRICMRIWKDPFTRKHEEMVNEAIVHYRTQLVPVFADIFNDIALSLN